MIITNCMLDCHLCLPFIVYKFVRSFLLLAHITKYSMSDGGRKLTLHRVNQRQEIMSIQCNVSNAYGYEYENIYLNVFGKSKMTLIDNPL